MCRNRGSNTGPLDLQSNALPTELSQQLENTKLKTFSRLWFPLEFDDARLRIFFIREPLWLNG